MNIFKKIICVGILFLFNSCILSCASPLTSEEALVGNAKFHTPFCTPTNDTVLFYKENIYLPITLFPQNIEENLTGKEDLIDIYLSIYPFKDFEDANPFIGEDFVYGQIDSIDPIHHTIVITQYLDDTTPAIEPHLSVYSNAIIILKRNDKQMNIDFSDLRVGDTVGMVIDKHHMVRGIMVED